MENKRGPRKSIIVVQENPEIIYHKWKINLKHFYLTHQQVLDEIQSNSLSVDTADEFMDWWIAVIGIFSHASVQWSIPSTWLGLQHKKIKVEMNEQMEQVRMSVKGIKQNIDEVLYEHRSNTNREDEHRHGIAKVQQVGKKRRTHRGTLQS